MLVTRILVAMAGIPLLLGTAYLGGWMLLLLVILMAFTGLVEFYHLAARWKLKPIVPAGIAGGLLFIVGAYFSKGTAAWMGAWLTLAMLLLFLALFPRVAAADVAITLLGSWYIGGMLAYLPLLRLLPGGAGILILAFLLTWANDTGAYFCGRIFGRRHPWPALSPGKTWAGAAGGLLATLIIVEVLGPLLLPAFNSWLLAGLAVLAAVAAQAGDLIESGFKRQAGVKDSGRLLPGHGGILDRFDSLLLVAPVVYYYVAFFL
ncbi:phosphatidate cytidylyltransferase [Moorella sulfitireducens]|uniref:phosphatidate cytidylyltransferase n=1 Tax=Neomoorella sulfitireducens TaxID=2972948 RepID=UPI0021AC2D4B|nr:phosphatidate cytidylyltransferase [Moorella sulfitireducens]